MNVEDLELYGRVLVIILGTTTLVGLGAKYLLLPWLRENLVKPVQETNTQVSVNSFITDPATLKDTVHDIQLRMEKIDETMHQMALTAANVAANTGVIQQMWDHHLNWSDSEVKRIWSAIDRINTHEGGKHESND